MNRIYVYHLPIYQYRLGRADQSSNILSLKKHYAEYYNGEKRILEFRKTISEEKIGALEAINNRLVEGITDLFVACFHIGKEETKNLYKELSLECPELLKDSMKASDLLNLYAKTHGLAYPLIKAYLIHRGRKKAKTEI